MEGAWLLTDQLASALRISNKSCSHPKLGRPGHIHMFGQVVFVQCTSSLWAMLFLTFVMDLGIRHPCLIASLSKTIKSSYYFLLLLILLLLLFILRNVSWDLLGIRKGSDPLPPKQSKSTDTEKHTQHFS